MRHRTRGGVLLSLANGSGLPVGVVCPLMVGMTRARRFPLLHPVPAVALLAMSQGMIGLMVAL